MPAGSLRAQGTGCGRAGTQQQQESPEPHLLHSFAGQVSLGRRPGCESGLRASRPAVGLFRASLLEEAARARPLQGCPHPDWGPPAAGRSKGLRDPRHPGPWAHAQQTPGALTRCPLQPWPARVRDRTGGPAASPAADSPSTSWWGAAVGESGLSALRAPGPPASLHSGKPEASPRRAVAVWPRGVAVSTAGPTAQGSGRCSRC